MRCLWRSRPKLSAAVDCDRAERKNQECAHTEIGSGLTSGQQNAVRAAFKAGVKPSAIARQFRISQSEVRKALAKEEHQNPDDRDVMNR